MPDDDITEERYPFDHFFHQRVLLCGFTFESHPAVRDIGSSFERNLKRIWSVDQVISQIMNASFNAGRKSMGGPESTLMGSTREIKIRDPQHTWAVDVLDAANLSHESVHLIHSTQLVGLWTAFEAMCADLWVAAVNASPGILGKNAFFAKSKTSEDAPDPTAEPQENNYDRKPKGLPYHLVADFGFDLSRSMGDYIKSTKKFDFNRLSGFHAAYCAAFASDVDKDLFKNVFSDMSEFGLVALELLRNVIVHRAGRMDKRFLKQAADLPSLSDRVEGQLVPLDREKIRQFNISVIEAGTKLAKFVSDWLRSKEIANT